MKRPFLPVTALLALALLGAPALGAPAPAAGGALELQPKSLESSHGRIEAESGQLMVPENRAVASSRKIPVRFLRLKSTASRPGAALFYLAGGPGDHGVSERKESLDFWAPYLAVCDVVLIDQRGVGDRDLTWQWDGPPPMAFFVDADSASRHEDEVQRRALAAIRARGVDLAGYTTAQSATDLDELRAALKLEKISLLAFSYGTHLACAYLRRYGDHVENAVMFGLEGPDQTYKLPWSMDTQFRKLALLSAMDPRIAKQVPDLVALYDRVVAKLAKTPMLVPVPLPDGKTTLQVPVGPFGLRFIMRIDMGDATDLPVFPRLLWSIDQGDPSVLAWFVRKRAGAALGFSGMNHAMDAASGATKGRLALIASQAATSRFADVVNLGDEPDPAMPDLGDDFRSPVVTGARVLLLSGTLDFNTPPYQSEEFRWGAPNATHLVVENAGHEQIFFQNDTVVPVVRDFLAGKDVKERRVTFHPLRFVPLTGTDPAVTHPSVTR
ncbi:MAG TPA: alpha/beta fold hydrolase [Methylomirabilota bacterium]|nr:alpha/beta fold hydrolase [Methylomirabilota bacterium]